MDQLKSLVLLFDEQLGVASLPALDLLSFRANGVTYRDLGAGYLTGHYDRLVDADAQLTGVQLWANPEAAGLAGLLDRLPPRPYLELLGGKPPIYRVFLSGTIDAEAEDTGEQAFGGQIFQGDHGEVALTIDVDYLCDGPRKTADFSALRAAPVRWTEIADLVQRAP